jgi:hypothetical protein
VSRRSRFTSGRPAHQAIGARTSTRHSKTTLPARKVLEGGRRFADDDGRTSASLRPKAMPGKAVAWRSRPGSATSGSGSRAKSSGDTVCGGSLTAQAAIEQRAGSVQRAGSMLRNAGAEVSCIQVADDHSQGRDGAYPVYRAYPRLRHQPRSANISPKKKTLNVSIPPFLVRRLIGAGTWRVRTSQKTTGRKTYESHGNRQGQQGVRGGYPS